MPMTASATKGTLMSPEETAVLGAKIDKLFGVTRDIQVAVATLSTKLESHEVQHAEYTAHRHETCPNAPDVRMLKSDVDAVAGIQRVHGVRLDKLEAWKSDVIKLEAVEVAETDLKMKPLAWLWRNVDKLLWLVVAAAVLYKLGL